LSSRSYSLQSPSSPNPPHPPPPTNTKTRKIKRNTAHSGGSDSIRIHTFHFPILPERGGVVTHWRGAVELVGRSETDERKGRGGEEGRKRVERVERVKRATCLGGYPLSHFSCG